MESTGQCVPWEELSGCLVWETRGAGGIQTRTGTIERVGGRVVGGLIPHFQCRGRRVDPWSGNYDPTRLMRGQKKKAMTPNLWPTLVLSFATMWVTGQCEIRGDPFWGGSVGHNG